MTHLHRLIGTEEVGLTFTESGVRRLAEVAFQVNENTENIGARRLQTILERLLDDISFTAADRAGETVTIDASLVRKNVGDLAKDADLSKFIL